ncbi:MAG: aminodeoxychorismate synthase component I [Bacteroidota bacterium]
MKHIKFIERTKGFLENKEPFFFIINFDKSKAQAYTYDEAFEKGILFDINGKSNLRGAIENLQVPNIPEIEVQPFPFKSYLQGFEKVVQNLKMGNSFLVNLTFPSKINAPMTLKAVYWKANAPYKLLFKDEFVCFSPECFIKIEDGYVYAYPMKGTIDATLEGAEDALMNSPKEQQEHHTIVDLIRNDLSMISRDVTVKRFRYLEKIKTAKGEIWQTSSEIRGKLVKNWQKDFGQLLLQMLPAGSISGAPKPQTLKIIDEVEKYQRGYYTGIFGIFDGSVIDTGVAIRFIEKKGDGFWYKSGGGITHQSNVKEEYIELINKIYIPTF